MKKYKTEFKPSACTCCSFSQPYTVVDNELVRRCEHLEILNYYPNKTTLEDCPLPCEGCSEEEYHCIREQINV